MLAGQGLVDKAKKTKKMPIACFIVLIFRIFDIEGLPMKNTENKVFSDTAKTVIFIHPAVQFTIDEKLNAKALYIKKAKKDRKKSGKSRMYYAEQMREAAKTDKDYLIMEYEPVIGELIENLRNLPGQYNFCRWHFDTFFHADTCPEGAKPDPMYNANDEKMKVLWWFCNHPFIWKYTIPVGHVLTLSDMKKLRKDYSEPESVKEIRRLMWNLRKGIKPKQIFPFYQADYKKLTAIRSAER